MGRIYGAETLVKNHMKTTLCNNPEVKTSYLLRDCYIRWKLPSSDLLCGMRWFKTDVSGLPIGPIFKGPKRRFQATSNRVISLKTEEVISIAAAIL
jgi:hypothetical protein